MTCDEVKPLLGAFLDNEVQDLLLSQRILEHLDTCPECAQALEAMSHVSQALRATPERYPVPTDLQAKISSATGVTTIKGRAEKSRRGLRWGSWVAYAALLAVVVLGSKVFLEELSGTKSELAGQLVADHIRSLQPGHLFDVPSSDKHTVKPWFQGKLDFSPSVPNLDAQGYPLLGGRLDYLNGQNAAVIVYGRGKHVINVFVMRRGVPFEGTQLDGYNLVGWNQGDLSYTAVSDVNPADLQAFRAKFTADS